MIRYLIILALLSLALAAPAEAQRQISSSALTDAPRRCGNGVRAVDIGPKQPAPVKVTAAKFRRCHTLILAVDSSPRQEVSIELSPVPSGRHLVVINRGSGIVRVSPVDTRDRKVFSLNVDHGVDLWSVRRTWHPINNSH